MGELETAGRRGGVDGGGGGCGGYTDVDQTQSGFSINLQTYRNGEVLHITNQVKNYL